MKAYALTFLVSSALLSGVSLAEPTKHVALIASPQTGQAVTRIDLVTIRMLGPGHPIVAVRSTEKGSHWWIQEAGKSDRPDEYVIRARFGNDKTPNGSRFEIVTLIAADAATAASIEPGTSMKQLPVKLVPGSINEVILNADVSEVDTPAKLRIELLSPLPNAEVLRDQCVSVRLQEPTGQLPLLLVRSTEPNSPWWVQEPMQQAATMES